MKRCFKCKKKKTLDNFSKNSSRKDGLSGQCKSCHKILRKIHYENNKDKVFKQVASRKDSYKEWYKSLKDNPCMDCGRKYPYYVMDFDHRENKKFSLSQCVSRGYNKERILNEISKCDLVCANCHRERTHNRCGCDVTAA